MPEEDVKDFKPSSQGGRASGAEAPSSEPDMTDNGSRITGHGSPVTDHDCPQCPEYLNGWKRAQADYANLKKEMGRAHIEMSSLANERAVAGLLPALDQFESALEHTPDISGLPEGDRKRLHSWLDGMRAVKSTWLQTLKDFGLENVDTTGVFDPSKHEAVGKEEDTSQPQDAIIRTVRRGWMMNGKVIRPAAVTVNSITEKND